jgi:hypothetical protein
MMKFSLFATVALSSQSIDVGAFSTPFKPRPSTSVSSLTNDNEIKVFDGLSLPDSFVPYEQTKWDDTPQQTALMRALIGKQKSLGKQKEPWSEDFLNMHKYVVDDVFRVNKEKRVPIDGYLSFGNQEHTKILSKLCQTNPFFASALTVSDDDNFLELNAYSELPKSDSDPKYLAIARELTDASHRINLRFNMDMTINQITTYESGEAVIVPEEDWDYYASGVCYNMVYYASCIHATIHTFHYYMTIGITESTRHDKSLKAWADPYDDNIESKQQQVGSVLLPSNLKRPGSEEDIVLTGVNSFGGTVEVMVPLRRYLSTWGTTCKTADEFTTKFLLSDLYATCTTLNPKKVIKNANILSEYMKHSDNIQPFARDLTRAMKRGFFPQRSSFKTAENNLRDFMKGCGEDVFSIDGISSWVQLISCTGIVHGSTLSYSRMLLTPEVIRWRDIKGSTYDANDVRLMSILGSTLQGMYEDRHTFTGSIEGGRPTDDAWNTSPICKKVRKVLTKYDKKAEALKESYEKTIQKRDDFKEFGWILTDHCTDGFDGKQHTMTTYL